MHVPLTAYGALLATYLQRQWRPVLILALLLFSSLGLQLWNPQIVRQFIDSAQAGTAQEALFGVALLYLAVGLAQQTLTVLATLFSENVGWTATNALRADLAAHVLRLDLGFHHAHTPGELIEHIDGDVTALANFFSQFVLRVLGNGLLLVGVLLRLAREDWRIGLVFTLFTLIALFVLHRLRGIATPH